MDEHEEICEHVTKLLNSEPLSSSPSLARFLTFCVDTTLAGEEQSLKETTIGVSCFGRSPGYDTKLDPIVRVTARRLRSKLALFYENEGGDHRVQINFPKGSYVPRFDRRADQGPVAVLPQEPEMTNLQKLPLPPIQAQTSHWPRYSAWGLLVLLCVALGSAGVTYVSAHRAATVISHAAPHSPAQHAAAEPHAVASGGPIEEKQISLERPMPDRLPPAMLSQGRQRKLQAHISEVPRYDAVASIEPRL